MATPAPRGIHWPKWLSALSAPIALIAGCHSSTQQLPAASASPTDFCAELGGAWDAPHETCGVTRTNSHQATIKIAEKYPADLVDNPDIGPTLKAYLRKIIDDSTRPQSSTLTEAGREGSVELQFSTFEHPPATKSVVFHEDWTLPGQAHPGNAIATFTFDLARNKQLQLADLFCTGVDPLKTLPTLVRPYLQQALANIQGSYAGAFPVEEFEPSDKPGSFADDYRAWALDGDDLVLYMPTGRGPAGMPAGLIQPRMPLSALHSILRDSGCQA